MANNVNNDFATGLSTCIAKDGQSVPTANIPLGGFKLTGLAAGTAAGDSVRFEQLQNTTQNWVVAGGTADVITATYSPAITALVDGQLVWFRASAANATTTPTFSPNGLTARTLTLEGGSALRVNEIPAALAEVVLRYNLANTRWELLNPAFARTGANTDITSLSAPALGAATAATQAAGDSSTKVATTAFVGSAVVGINWTPFNAEDRVWGAGTATVKTSWTAYGAGATYAKETNANNFRGGVAGSKITRVGTDCGQSQNILLVPGWPTISYWQGKTVTWGRWVLATVASRARIGINDGVGQTFSSYHTGNSTLQFLTVTRTLNVAATAIALQDQVDTGDTTAWFSGGGFVTGSALTDACPPVWAGRKCIYSLGAKSAGLLPASNTIFFGGSGEVSTLESDIYALNPLAKSVVRNLQYYTATQPGGAATHVATLRITGSTDTALTCTVTGAANSAQDLTHEVNLAQFQAGTVNGTFTLKAVASGGAATTGSITASIEIEEVPL